MSNYLEIVDKVIIEAYKEGFCIVKKEVWDVYAVRYRLNYYGKEDAIGRYYLNEQGIEYAISGCSKGIKERIKRQEEIERLEIETQSFTKRKQNYTFWMATIGGGLAILQAILAIIKAML